MNELVQSVKKYGILQPILLRKLGDSYEIVAGERRYRSAKLAGLKTIPAIVKDFDDREIFNLSIVENVQRKDLNPIEEASAYRHLMDTYGYSQQDISDIIGKSRSHIANLLRLLNLPESIQTYLLDGKIEMGHARALIGCTFAEEIIDNIIDNNLSVREVESMVRDMNNDLNNKAPPEKMKRLVPESIRMKASELSKKINLKCKINYDAKKKNGTINIRFDSLDELDNFIDGL
ncbi:chromosome segregation DNA-binding protein [Bacilli bacterium]|nr:chromosome segregation DNA-binding protein [Bacilli bacterium]